jgi:hypothetical protein
MSSQLIVGGVETLDEGSLQLGEENDGAIRDYA